MKACLNCDVKLISLGIKGIVSIVCDVASPLIPLLVEEGYLFVEENGVKYFLCVDK